jgi:hypothetical protein
MTRRWPGLAGYRSIAGVAEVVCEDDLVREGVAERAGQGVHAAYPRTSIK